MKAALTESETPSQSGFPLVGVTGFEFLSRAISMN